MPFSILRTPLKILKTTLLLTSIALVVQMAPTFAQSTPTISSISPSNFRPGTLVEISGSGFGNAPFEGTQLCFSNTLCTSSATFSAFIKNWTNSTVTIVVPYQDLPTTGQLTLAFPNANGATLVRSPNYTFNKADPVVLATSTKDVIPGNTSLVINGSGFLDFTGGKSTICVNNNCLTDTTLGQNITSWKDSEIVTKIPYVQGTNTFSINIVVFDKLLNNIQGATPIRIVEVPGFSYKIPEPPRITALAPIDVYPGRSILTITGTGFGESYRSGSNQICFGERCLSDGIDIPALLISWSPTKVELRAPLWLSVATVPIDSVNLRLLDVLAGQYTFVNSPSKIVIRPVPVITETVPIMQMGATYMVRGKSFGTNQGSITLNGSPLDIRSWSDTSVSFWIGENARSGPLQITSSTGDKSQEASVSIESQAVYSKDEFTRLMWYFGTLGIKEAWSKTMGSSNVIVAVIDSGIDFTHDELKGTAWKNTREVPNNGVDDDKNGYIDDISGWNFVSKQPAKSPLNAHGTMVASIIAAKSNNFIGLAGVAPNVQLMNLQVTTSADENFSEDYITLASAQEAIKYAVDNGADVINLSFASETDSPVYGDILAYAHARNVLVVIAAGNDGKDLNKQKFSPVCDDGNNPYALGVTSIDQEGYISSFANNGSSCIDIAAPGERIIVAAPPALSEGKYMLSEGTSFATPLVAGTAALIRSLHPDWNVAEVRSAILTSAKLQNGIRYLDIAAAVRSGKPGITYSPDNSASGEIRNDSDIIFKSDPVPSDPMTTIDENGNSEDSNLPERIDQLEATKDPARTFKDVAPTSPYYIPVTELSRQGVIQGYADGSYRPLANVNRAEFVKILIEGAGISPDPSKYQNCFPDVTTEWYAPYVCYAQEQGIVEGYPGATSNSGKRLFRPDQSINKVEALKVILEFHEVPLAEGSNSFSDAEKGSWYYPYATTAEQLQLIDERFTLRPSDALSRGVMAQVIYRIEAIKKSFGL